MTLLTGSMDTVVSTKCTSEVEIAVSNLDSLKDYSGVCPVHTRGWYPVLCTDHAGRWVKINWGSIGALNLDHAILDNTIIALYNVHAIFK